MASKMNGLVNGHVENYTTTNSDIITTLRSRFEHAKYGDSMKNNLIEVCNLYGQRVCSANIMQDLITRYETLMHKHEAYITEHHEERNTAKLNREQLQMYQSHAFHMQNIMNRDPNILVLVHGDEVIFNDSLLQSGFEGGKQAAHLLHDEVKKWAVVSVKDLPPDTKIVVRIYANLKLLAESCVFAGVVGSPFAVEEFTRGFTSERKLCTFIDVPNTADQIAEELELYLYNYHCRHILLGGSRNKGYHHIIAQRKDDEEALNRLSLLQGSPLGPELAEMPFNKVKFQGLFRNTEINLGLDHPTGTYDEIKGAQPRVLTSPLTVPRVDSRIGLQPSALSANGDVFVPRSLSSKMQSPQSSVTSLSVIGQDLHNRSDSFASSAAEPSGSGGTWAFVTKKSKHLPQTDQTPRPVKEPEYAVKRNRFNQRIDTPIECDYQEAKKLKDLKACNQHFIGIGCCHYKANRADKCPHNHDLNLNSKQLKMLKAVARETVCKRGHECADPDCINGHACPFPLQTLGSMRGTSCINGENCRFPRSMHGMDMTAVKTIRATGAF